eukprot:753019-Pyramimonas_sp.AAC.1
MWLIAGDATLKFVHDGVWLHEREALNDRGDESSILDKKRSWEEHGLYSDIRAGAWVRPQENTLNLKPDTNYFWLHFATLMEGGKA